MSELLLSPKYKKFLRTTDKPVEFLEGTTYAGKTTVGAFKFLLMVARDKSTKASVIAGLDTGTVEKNIINAELGLMDIFGDALEYNGAGTSDNKLPHLVYHTPNGRKIIYVLGYGDKKRWTKALGSQFYGLYIDEINIADIDFVHESTMRCDYLMGTLNPDNPALDVYKEYINKSRPLPEYKDDAPTELLNMLNEPPMPNWVWWYFSFDHNAGLTSEKREQIISSVPTGTKIYKNKILGLRGKSTGLVFSNFSRQNHVIPEEKAREFTFARFSAGLDTAYSSKSADTIAMSFIGITTDGKCILLEERVYNNAVLNTPIAPSDTVVNFIDFLERCREKWGGCRDAFIDSADQATLTEFAKHKRQNGSIYTFNGAWKKTKIVDRISLQLGWFAKGDFLIVNNCNAYITELETYAWEEDKDLVPEDANDHMVNSVQYAFLPYISMIGAKK